MGAYSLQLLTIALLLGSAATVICYLADESGIIHVGGATTLGVGAYVFAIGTVSYGLAPFLVLVLTLPFGIVFGFIIDAVTARLTKHHLALMTLAIAVIGHGVMLNWSSVTGGAIGITAVPPLVKTIAGQLVLVAFVSLVIACSVWFLPKTMFGLRVRTFRDDESLSSAMLLRPRDVRRVLFAGSSAALALVGGLYGAYLRNVDPSPFVLNESIALLAMAVAFPLRPVIRGFIGAAAFVAIPEALWFIGIQSASGAHVRHLIFGGVLVVSLLRRESSPAPTGLRGRVA